MTEGQCPVYGNLKEKYENIDNDEDLIRLFNEILEMRETLEEEERRKEEERKEREKE